MMMVALGEDQERSGIMSCKYDHEYPVWCYQEKEECRTHEKADYCPSCGSPLSDPTPLTMEELRGMDGKKISVIRLVKESVTKPDFDNPEEWTVDNDKWFFEGYGKTWLAYTHKLKDREGEG